MAESVYKVIELVGTSTESWEKAAKVAIERAAKTLRDLRVAEIVEQVADGLGHARGGIELTAMPVSPAEQPRKEHARFSLAQGQVLVGTENACFAGLALDYLLRRP